MHLIPLPRKITVQDGLFSIGHNTAIILDVELNGNDLETAKLLQQEIKKIIAITLPIKKVLRSERNIIEKCIYFKFDNKNTREVLVNIEKWILVWVMHLLGIIA